MGCEPMCLETGRVLKVHATGMRTIARKIRLPARLPRIIVTWIIETTGKHVMVAFQLN